MAKKKPDWAGLAKASYHAYQAHETITALQQRKTDPGAMSPLYTTLVYLGVADIAIIIALL
jgi:hypothetical protein